MMERSILRTLFGGGLFGMTGVSLVAGVFPWIMSLVFDINSYEIMFVIRGFIMPIGLGWAVGGGIIGWQGGASTGALIAGICGLVSGLILGALVIDGNALLIMASMLSGLIYGAIGGLIIGRAFPKSMETLQ